MANNGKQGEALFKQLMENRGYQVEDVSADPQYYYKGDFLVTSPTTGLTKIIECKWDTKINKSGNLYLEFINTNSPGGAGWYESCKADYLAYGNAKTNVFLMVDMQELRQRVDKMKHKPIGFCGNNSCGYLIHVSQLDGLLSLVE